MTPCPNGPAWDDKAASFIVWALFIVALAIACHVALGLEGRKPAPVPGCGKYLPPCKIV